MSETSARHAGYGVCGHGPLCTREACRVFPQSARIHTVWIPGALRNTLNGAHGHWSTVAAYRKRWRVATKVCILASKLGLKDPASPKHVTMTAHVWNRLDSDGLQAGLKSVRDGMVDAGVVDSDAPTAPHVWEYAQVIDRKARGVRVEWRAR